MSTRDQFEQWVNSQPWYIATIGLERRDGEYIDPCINSRWQGWQALAATIEARESAGEPTYEMLDAADAWAEDHGVRVGRDALRSVYVAMQAVAPAAQPADQAVGLNDYERGYNDAVAERDEWRKRESATPEPGTWVQLASTNGLTQEVGRLIYEGDVGYWDTGKFRVYKYSTFSHWMPLPPMPSSTRR